MPWHEQCRKILWRTFVSAHFIILWASTYKHRCKWHLVGEAPSTVTSHPHDGATALNCWFHIHRRTVDEIFPLECDSQCHPQSFPGMVADDWMLSNCPCIIGANKFIHIVVSPCPANWDYLRLPSPALWLLCDTWDSLALRECCLQVACTIRWADEQRGLQRRQRCDPISHSLVMCKLQTPPGWTNIHFIIPGLWEVFRFLT